MRSALLLVLVGCASDAPLASEPVSMRERLAREAHLFVTEADSAGVITAQLRTSAGWSDGLVDLAVASRQLVVASDCANITLGALQLALRNVDIPSSVLGHAAELANIRVALTAPVQAAPAWSGDDQAQLTADLHLALSWSVTVDGAGL